MKPVEFSGLGRTLAARHTHRWPFDRILSVIRSVVRAVAADHAVAHEAAAKAESSRANLAGVRALYLPPPVSALGNTRDGGDLRRDPLRPDPPRVNAATRKVAVDFQSWHTPHAKSAKCR
ncbi:MAG: hypothetical protein ABI607_08600 [Betaproteobacteria bacterium]